MIQHALIFLEADEPVTEATIRAGLERLGLAAEPVPGDGDGTLL